MSEILAYPARLLPQPTYRLLTNPALAAGVLVRRTPQPQVTDATGKILPDQLSHPTEDLARHFSVNLLGDFQLPDLAWNAHPALDKPGKARLFASWQPHEPVPVPTSAEMECLPAGSWGYCWLLLAELDEQVFDSIGESFTCRVCHAPTQCNYWHFELHFHTQHGDVYHLDPRQRKKVAPKIRSWLQDYVLTYPSAALPVAAPWPEQLYDARVSD